MDEPLIVKLLRPRKSGLNSSQMVEINPSTALLSSCV